MPLGPGVYDKECGALRELLHAKGVLLLVVDGAKGSGFSAQLPIELLLTLPTTLRGIAAQIEASGTGEPS